MYNEEIKKRYIQEKEATTSTPVGYLARAFNKSDVYEKRIGKDISCFTAYEILDYYKTLNMSSVESLRVLNSHLSLYTQWCLQQNLVADCQNHFLEVNEEGYLKCINMIKRRMSIISREELGNWLKELLNVSDAFLMLALFEGIKGKEFCELRKLKISDFDGNKVKLCTGRELTVSDELIELARKANETLTYYSVSLNSLKTGLFLDEDLIIKNYHNCQQGIDEFQQGRRIYRRLLRNFEFLGVSDVMRPNSLCESGKIDYILQRSKELNITPKEFVFTPQYAKEVEYRYGCELSRLKVSFMKKYEEYLV